jgi:capsule polysaccharide export protein KpsE/RkpR
MKQFTSATVRLPGPQPSEQAPAPAPREAPQQSHKLLPSFRLLWDHRRLLGRVTLYGLLASALVAFLIPSRYQSVAHLMPPDSQSGSGLAVAAAAMAGAVGSGALGGMASDLLGMKSSSDIFVGIIGSRTAEDKLIEQFNLRKIYRDRRMEDARLDLEKHTSVAVDRKSQIVTIAVTDKNPQRAAAMCQAYIEQLNTLVSALSTSAARRERIFLEDRLQTVNRDLENAEKEFSEFASKNSAIDVKEQGRAMLGAAATLQGELIAAESQYQGLRQIYTDTNPRVRTLKARIDELKHQLNNLAGKGESTTDASSLPTDSLYPSIRKLPLLGVTYADLYRKTKIQEAVLETLTRQYELAKVQEAKEIPTVKVLDAPHIPDKKSFPPRSIIIAAGTCLTFGFAVVWVLAKSEWEHTDPADPRKIFAKEVFASIKSNIPGASKNGVERSVPGPIGETDPYRDSSETSE